MQQLPRQRARLAPALLALLLLLGALALTGHGHVRGDAPETACALCLASSARTAPPPCRLEPSEPLRLVSFRAAPPAERAARDERPVPLGRAPPSTRLANRV